VTVRLILSDTGIVVSYVKRRVAVFPGPRSKNRMIVAAMIIRDGNHDGIIRLTFTA
jgi:hypothetical protein